VALVEVLLAGVQAAGLLLEGCEVGLRPLPPSAGVLQGTGEAAELGLRRGRP
jgi:hypothetical protein